MREYKKWSKSEEQYLLDHYKVTPKEDIIQELSRFTWKEIVSKYSRLTLKDRTEKETVNYHRYTPEEDKLIVKYISKSPDNLTEAFEKLSKKLNTSYRSVSHRYYRTTRYTSNYFFSVSKNKVQINNKVKHRKPNCKPVIQEIENKSIFTKIVDFINKNIIKLKF